VSLSLGVAEGHEDTLAQPFPGRHPVTRPIALFGGRMPVPWLVLLPSQQWFPTGTQVLSLGRTAKRAGQPRLTR
jgi:hypothetical protein